MDLAGSRLIPASLASVRAGLDDPETLKACIPGCERLERASGDAFEGTIATKIGPIRCAFVGTVAVASRDADGWSITAEGADEAAGTGRGSGRVTLTPAEGGALLAYEGTAEVDGKIGQLGSRLASGFARQSIETFLANLAERAAAGRLPAGAASAAPEPPVTEAPPLVHEEAAAETATILETPPIAGTASPFPQGPAPIAPTAVPEAPDPAAIVAAEAAGTPKEGGGSVGRIMLVAAIAVAVGVAIYFGFLQRPPG